jgi:lysine-ketoglutarate reductase/saccharopine dehydrogenase-like protein (TIGR00300 family)
VNYFQEVKYKVVRNKGIAPRGFYATSNRKTSIFFKGKLRKVRNLRMDGVIVVKPRPECKLMRKLQKGEMVAVGKTGIREELSQAGRNDEFSFMSSSFSSERNNAAMIGEVAKAVRKARMEGKKVLVVCGPVVVHSGAREWLASLIKNSWVDVLFSGNALALHDIEASLLGTSLGISLTTGKAVEGGHSNHLTALNEIQHAGGIRKAVEKGIIKDGIMYQCIKRGVKFVLAASIRDDGPLGEVISDACEAQEEMMKNIKGVGICIVVGSMLHGIATGNMLSEEVRLVCVDTEPTVVNKLVDRGSVQSIGLVCGAREFLEALNKKLGEADA